jgi:hypothetical protein
MPYYNNTFFFFLQIISWTFTAGTGGEKPESLRRIVNQNIFNQIFKSYDPVSKKYIILRFQYIPSAYVIVLPPDEFDDQTIETIYTY